MFDYLNC